MPALQLYARADSLVSQHFDDEFLNSPFSADQLAHASKLALNACSENTKRHYNHAWKSFTLWCQRYGAPAMPSSPQVVSIYLAEMSQSVSHATLKVHLAAIRAAHYICRQQNPTSSPTVRAMMRGIGRTNGKIVIGKKPLMADDIVRVVTIMRQAGVSPTLDRDLALLTLGFASALRGGELVSLRSDCIEFIPGGVTILIPRSKTDPYGGGHRVGVGEGASATTCPVRTLRTWMEHLPPDHSPLFPKIMKNGKLASVPLHREHLNRVVKRSAVLLGYDPSEYGTHSLRAGFVTTAYETDFTDSAIMMQTRHRSLENLRKYIRPQGILRKNLTVRMGL